MSQNREFVFVNHPNDKPYLGEICGSQQNTFDEWIFDIRLPDGEVRERVPAKYVYEAKDPRINEMLAARTK